MEGVPQSISFGWLCLDPQQLTKIFAASRGILVRTTTWLALCSSNGGGPTSKAREGKKKWPPSLTDDGRARFRAASACSSPRMVGRRGGNIFRTLAWMDRSLVMCRPLLILSGSSMRSIKNEILVRWKLERGSGIPARSGCRWLAALRLAAAAHSGDKLISKFSPVWSGLVRP
ncbi:hypothetical protein BO94DRAFT_19659 [Aspergillus sclerotioniger CBS 115572]|uniref:Uncharacterized protein n=1 Tax=Aspergillus sclerotioniger CBS 115572 TaxID=1450535 RepID=A0A317XFV4_9EURO|nr:hypothetical protein BO94DRAFT_19659 [Aspergillus sclerotioniger CBS 115572]PWY96772.1 hypothetical protein BO94DRAFT_19659 [Aspergillus sclerotioniger CBS 115572]